jgi:predicted 3-demethylubiquinone-9 3-methyltransferase (glyoxalase superfamily)
MTHSIRTVLWFNGRGREAAAFYCSLIPGSRVERAMGGDTFDVIDFTLGGVPYQILDAGPMFPQSECVSIAVQTDGQAETDRLWVALTAEGGQESMCGWLKDRFGLSWQIYPKGLLALTLNPDKALADRAMAAMMTMRRIDLAVIEAAARQP